MNYSEAIVTIRHHTSYTAVETTVPLILDILLVTCPHSEHSLYIALLTNRMIESTNDPV